MTSLPFKLVEITADDFVELIAFDQQFYLDGTPFLAADAPPLLTVDELHDALSKNEKLFWIDTSCGQHAGYYWIERRVDSLYLAALVVAPLFRKQRIGRRVLDLIDNAAQQLSLSQCTLAVSPRNVPALGLYFSHGYFVTGYNRNHFNEAQSGKFRVLMEKHLQQAERGDAQIVEHVPGEHHERIVELIDKGYVGEGIVDAHIAFAKY